MTTAVNLLRCRFLAQRLAHVTNGGHDVQDIALLLQLVQAPRAGGRSCLRVQTFPRCHCTVSCPFGCQRPRGVQVCVCIVHHRKHQGMHCGPYDPGVARCRDFLATVSHEMLDDATLQRESGKTECSECKRTEVALIQVPTTAADERLRLVYLCAKCGHKWES